MSFNSRRSPVRGCKFPLLVALVAKAMFFSSAAHAVPVCTDGYMGGPPRALCGLRVFPEAALSQGYIQFNPYPETGFREFQHGVEYLAQLYPRWISITTLREHFGNDHAVSVGDDGIRPGAEGDTGDGRDILVIRLTDHNVPDEGKHSLFFSLAVHGNERSGLEGGVRTVEDLAMAAESGGTIVDGVANYESSTGRLPVFHEYYVADVLAREVVYFVDFNPDGWAVGDVVDAPPVNLYERGNGLGTDLNRQMPTVGRIDRLRTPLQEPELYWGTELMREVAAAGRNGKMTFGGDIHGELTSNAFIDIMYPGGQFDSVDHRRLMAIAERTKSVIDRDLYAGMVDVAEALGGGNDSEPPKAVATKPAHWATVWDTLGYTDTGFIGDYMATDLAVTGMDYELFLNHTAPDKVWTVALQEAHIAGTRAIIKTAMAYALTQDTEFSHDNVVIDPVGRAGYVYDPDTVTDSDENGAGSKPGFGGVNFDGEKLTQHSYTSTRMRWFEDTSRLMPEPFVKLLPADIAADPSALDVVDTLVLADDPLPEDELGRAVDKAAYYAAIRAWVLRGGNLVLTDRAVHALSSLGVVDRGAVSNINVYLPYTDIQDFEHAMVRGLRPNARQLVDTTLLGYGIDPSEAAAFMSVVNENDWVDAGGHIVGTTGAGRVSVGEAKLGDGLIRIVGGALPIATEENDHRFGLRDYAMTYTGLFIMENSIRHDAPGLGEPGTASRTTVSAPAATATSGSAATVGGSFGLALLIAGLGFGLRRRHV